MERRKSHRVVLAVIVMGSLLPVAGCFIWNSDVNYGEKGAPLSDSTLQQIESGKTTRDWVMSTLGEPSEQSTTDAGVELLKYKYSKRQESNVVMPFVIVNDEKKNEQTVYLEVKDGVVQKYWVESSKR
jgi:outer membrane protein assembly factor BamE (lipoprotein component of BamABCDE complex)